MLNGICKAVKIRKRSDSKIYWIFFFGSRRLSFDLSFWAWNKLVQQLSRFNSNELTFSAIEKKIAWKGFAFCCLAKAVVCAIKFAFVTIFHWIASCRVALCSSIIQSIRRFFLSSCSKLVWKFIFAFGAVSERRTFYDFFFGRPKSKPTDTVWISRIHIRKWAINRQSTRRAHSDWDWIGLMWRDN